MLSKNELILIRDLFEKMKPGVTDSSIDAILNFMSENTTSIETIVSKINKSLNESEISIETTRKVPNILVVDDAESMRSIIRSALKEIGFDRITLANNAKSALSQLKLAERNGMPFTLVITDWEMGDISGLQLLKKIRGDETLSDTPVHILTSVQQKDSIKQAIDAGVNGYITKPISLDIMKKKFSKYL